VTNQIQTLSQAAEGKHYLLVVSATKKLKAMAAACELGKKSWGLARR